MPTKKPIAQTAKENPVVASILSVGALAVAGVAIWEGAGLVDRLHVTEAELVEYDKAPHSYAEQQHQDLNAKIDLIKIEDECRWLKSEIRALEDSIYRRTRDGADNDYLRDLQNDLADLQEKYIALDCSRVLI